MKSLAILSVLVSLITTLLFGGCNKSSMPPSQIESSGTTTAVAHEPEEIPMTDAEIASLKQSVTTYAVALTKIKSYRGTIREVLAASEPHKAHRPLDELNVLLEYLPTVARDNNIPKSHWETVNTSSQKLRDSFSKVHAQIDGGEKANYAAVAAEIDSALASLETAQSAN